MEWELSIQDERMKHRVMTVRGEASITVQPDMATIQLEVVTKDEQVSKAKEENAQIMSQVINALLELGISKENIQTSFYTIQPIYDYKDGEQVFRGYEVRNSVTVKIQDINQAGQVIDIAVKNGVNQVSGIEFTVQHSEAYYRRALSQSLNDALFKAHTLAETMKVSYDQIPVKITELSDQPPAVYKTYALEVSTTTPIEPGQIIINASIEGQFNY